MKIFSHRKSRYLSLIMMFSAASAEAQIIGDFSSSISPDTLSVGDAQNGFGLAALRKEDKARMQRLRERYLELNPVNTGVVEVFDIDTAMPQKILEDATHKAD